MVDLSVETHIMIMEPSDATGIPFTLYSRAYYFQDATAYYSQL